MCLYTEILEIIQQISAIYAKKGIPSSPANLDYLDVVIAPDMETVVLHEMIMYLDDLLADYQREEKRPHRFARYSDHFKNILDDNTDGSMLIGRKVS